MKILPEETRQAVKELERKNREGRKNIVLGCQHRVLIKDNPFAGHATYTCEDCSGTVTVERGQSSEVAIRKMEEFYAKF
jgi:transposase-like protein